jgi:hypothetical protein
MIKLYKIQIHHPRSKETWTSKLLELDEVEYKKMKETVIKAITEKIVFFLEEVDSDIFISEEIIKECTIRIISL